jgi:multiple sugar transport system ATP-binding protein
VTHDQTEAMTLGDRVAVMRTGTIQQVASPQELYDQPANLFVAGFIGSPAMNFMSGTLEEGKLRTPLGDVPLSGRLQQELSGSAAGRDVIAGIRPEDFEDAALVPSENRQNGITFPATIDVVESLGSEKYVYFSKDIGKVETAELAELARDSGRADTGASAETVVARIDPATRITEGHNAELWVDVRSVHVFDPATGKNLTRGGSGSSAAATSASGDGGAAAQAGSRPDGTGADTAAGTDTGPAAGGGADAGGTDTGPAAGTGTDPAAGTGTDPAAGTGTDPAGGTGTGSAATPPR